MVTPIRIVPKERPDVNAVFGTSAGIKVYCNQVFYESATSLLPQSRPPHLTDRRESVIINHMVRILFVCLGNICRSPMAEFIMKDLAKRKGLDCIVQSAATSGEEEGNPVFSAAVRTLAAHGIAFDSSKRARKATFDDYFAYDYIFGMESRNVERLRAIFGSDPQNKLKRLLDGTARPRDIADPWYSGDFEQTYADIAEGCEALIAQLQFKTYLSIR